MSQVKQNEWHEQWSLFRDEERFLFTDWIAPNALEDFRNKEVLECGCGGGQHTFFIAPYAREVVAVDLNTTNIAQQRNCQFTNVHFVEADIAEMDLKRQFDIVYSIGVVHHTDDPDKTIENIKRHVKPGGKMIVWVYSSEGNFMVEHFVEPLRKLLLKHFRRSTLAVLSKMITVLMYIPIYTVYLLPIPFLPYYSYFNNFRKLSFRRNVLNVFDKLNAPQVQFITQKRIEKWFKESDFSDIRISPYVGVSWRGSGVKKP